MTATNRYRNAGPVTFNSITLNGVKSCSYDEGNDTLFEGADFDAFPTVGGVIFTKPKVTVETINAAQIAATAAGTKSTFVYTLRDYYNGATASGGAMIYTMSNAFLTGRTQSAPFNQLATQSLTFEAISTDGSTHPMAVAAA